MSTDLPCYYVVSKNTKFLREDALWSATLPESRLFTDREEAEEVARLLGGFTFALGPSTAMAMLRAKA